MTDPVDAPPRRQTPATRVLGVLVTGVALIGCAEIGLRLFDFPARPHPLARVPAPWRTDPTLVADAHALWRCTPDLATTGHPPDAAKTASHFRILVVGDGNVCGHSVAQVDGFAARLALAAQREARAARVDVMLLGAPGHSTYQSLRLFERYGADFAPDLVVTYPGIYHDLSAAATAPDAEVARDVAGPTRWHLARLWRQWTEPAATHVDTELRPGEEPTRGRRVSPQDCEQNVRRLLAGARALGAEACVVLPGLAKELEDAQPIAARYRDALRSAAKEAGAYVIDGDGVLGTYEASLHGAPCPEIGLSTAFRDVSHLTAGAHGVIADALMTRVRAHPRFAAFAGKPATAAPRVDNVQPPSILAFATDEVRLSGRGFQSARSLRVWLGGAPSQVLQIESDTELRVRVPAHLVPGRHAIDVSAEGGASTIAEDIALEVRPASLEVSLRRTSGVVQVQCSGRAAPHCRVQVFVAPAGCANPVDSPAGPFWLRFGEMGAKPSRAPLCFGNLPLANFSTTADATGQWQVVSPWQTPDAADATNAVVQGVVWLGEGGRAVATDVIVRVVPR